MADKIRPMAAPDKPEIVEMMRVFYASDAVSTDGSEEIFSNDVDACLSDSPYLEGFVIEESGKIKGYAMIAKSFSTEFGKPCIWIEDLYVKAEYRGLGLGSALLNFITESFPDSIFRLEVEDYNEKAIKVYKKCGFDTLPYMEMKK